jgi:hypothetical protein
MMEFIWRPDFYHNGARGQIFSHIIYDFETSPFDLVFDAVQRQIPPPPTPEDEDEEQIVVPPS